MLKNPFVKKHAVQLTGGPDPRKNAGTPNRPSRSPPWIGDDGRIEFFLFKTSDEILYRSFLIDKDLIHIRIFLQQGSGVRPHAPGDPRSWQFFPETPGN